MRTLRIAHRNYGDFESALVDEARLFEASHPGVAIELVSVGIHELYESTLKEGGLRDGHFDLALLVTDWLAEGMSTGSLEDLHQWQRIAPISDWPEGWAASLVRPLMIDGQSSSLPWHDGPECLVYRKDLFEDARLRAEHRERLGRDLAPPTTWAEFEETARFLTDPAKGRFGTVFAAFPDGHNTLYDFALQVWSRGGELLDGAGRAHVNSTEAIQGLEFYRRVARDPSICHPQSPAAGLYPIRRSLSRGRGRDDGELVRICGAFGARGFSAGWKGGNCADSG